MMKNYVSPEIEISTMNETDIIATSLGTETSRTENEEGFWEI